MATARSFALAAAVLAVAAALSRLPFGPVELHTLATSAVLLVGVLVAPGADPGWFPRSRRLAVVAPRVIAVTLALACLALVLGPLQIPATAALPSLQGALVVAIVPIAEEAFFRGALLRLAPRHRAVSVASSAALFGMLHLALGWPAALMMTLAACALGALAVYTRAISLAVVLHASFNGLAVAYREAAPLALLLPVVIAFGLSSGPWRKSR